MLFNRRSTSPTCLAAVRAPQLRSRITEALGVIAEAERAAHDSAEEGGLLVEAVMDAEATKPARVVSKVVVATADAHLHTNIQADTQEVPAGGLNRGALSHPRTSLTRHSPLTVE